MKKEYLTMKKTFILLIISFTALLFAQEYSFDFNEFKKKPYEYVGSFQVQSEISELNKSSNLYKLSFLNKEEKDIWDSYSTFVQLKGSYEISRFKILLNLKDRLTYTTNDEFENDFNIYESFLNTSFSTNWDLQIGKKSVKWGKGYIWNPVSFVGRQKNINDVDGDLEGFWMLKFGFVKSFSGFLQNFSINPIIIPVQKDINEDFSDDKTVNFILNNYFLVADTDFDTYLFYENSEFKRFGLDFARNILTNWEIHAEYVFQKHITETLLNLDFTTESSYRNSHDYLFGTRILFETNTTLILEYLHNDSGIDKRQMNTFFDATKIALYENPNLLPTIKNYQLENFNSQFLMKDYLYLKLSHPEPFDILYFTPGMFILYNIDDKSQMIGGEFSYSRFDNLNLKLKYNLLLGELKSEFGGKISSEKLSLLIDYSF